MAERRLDLNIGRQWKPSLILLCLHNRLDGGLNKCQKYYGTKALGFVFVISTDSARQDHRFHGFQQLGRLLLIFFTGASDPLCGTPYKLFTFSNPMPHSSDKEDELNDNGTNRLWDLWRKKALARTTINAPLRDTLLEMEEDGLSQLLECNGNIPIKRQSTFAEMVQREIELLEN